MNLVLWKVLLSFLLPADCSMLVSAVAQCKPEVICLKAAKKLFGGVVKLPGEYSAIITSVHTLFRLQTTCAHEREVGQQCRF